MLDPDDVNEDAYARGFFAGAASMEAGAATMRGEAEGRTPIQVATAPGAATRRWHLLAAAGIVAAGMVAGGWLAGSRPPAQHHAPPLEISNSASSVVEDYGYEPEEPASPEESTGAVATTEPAALPVDAPEVTEEPVQTPTTQEAAPPPRGETPTAEPVEAEAPAPETPAPTPAPEREEVPSQAEPEDDSSTPVRDLLGFVVDDVLGLG